MKQKQDLNHLIIKDESIYLILLFKAYNNFLTHIKINNNYNNYFDKYNINTQFCWYN